MLAKYKLDTIDNADSLQKLLQAFTGFTPPLVYEGYDLYLRTVFYNFKFTEDDFDIYIKNLAFFIELIYKKLTLGDERKAFTYLINQFLDLCMGKIYIIYGEYIDRSREKLYYFCGAGRDLEQYIKRNFKNTQYHEIYKLLYSIEKLKELFPYTDYAPFDAFEYLQQQFNSSISKVVNQKMQFSDISFNWQET